MQHTISQKLLKAREDKGVSKSEMARQLGVASQLYGKYERGEIQPKEAFRKKFREVFGTDLSDNETKVSEPKGIPLIPIEAMAGIAEGEFAVEEYQAERFIIPTFRGADFLIPVRGSSMQPKYNSGDIVACKRLNPKDIFWQWNKVYVLDTDQGALIKRVEPGSNKETLMLVSENDNYPPFELSFSQIYSISVVMGVIRLE